MKSLHKICADLILDIRNSMGHRDSDIGVTDLEVSSSLGYRGYEPQWCNLGTMPWDFK